MGYPAAQGDDVMALRLILICALVGVVCMMANAASYEMKQIDGQAELGTAEIIGVGAGDFQPSMWESGKLNFMPDVRHPLIEPLKRGLFRNIYAPSIVDLGDKWRVFYGAWDGVDSGNDRIYSRYTNDFLDFTDREIVIEHGDFIHCCNVNVSRLPSGEYRMMCTVYPDTQGQDKPGVFTSPDGTKWNGSPTPYPAKMSDVISMEGYDKFREADINGMNVLLPEDGVFRIYFNNFKDFGRVYRATSQDGKHFTFDGPVLEVGAFVNDVKKLTAAGKTYYLMGLHRNGDLLLYSLSTDGKKFPPSKDLAKSLGAPDRYIVAIGWVVRQNRVLGFLYGAGAAPSLDRNRIFGRWLQKKVVFVADDGTRYEGTSALGPDRQIISVPKGEVKGHFEVYAEDGTTRLAENLAATLVPGAVYVLSGR